jgi:hypothetical protein
MTSIELGEPEASRIDISKESGDKRSSFLPSKQENSELVDIQIVEKIRELVERKLEDEAIAPPQAEGAEDLDQIIEAKNKMRMFAKVGKSILDSRAG